MIQSSIRAGWVVAVLVSGVVGCSGSEATNTNNVPLEPVGAAGGSGGSQTAFAGAGGGASNPSAGAGGSTTSNPVELPPGSREVEGVVNLVDAAAAQQLEEFLLSSTPQHVVLRQGLTKPFNLFIEHYLEEYDFVFFVTDHVVEGVRLAGKFEAMNRPAAPGGGNEIEIATGGYRTTGRTKGVIGIPYWENYYPPLSHEVGHYWLVHLDPRFGFGVTLDGGDPLHWGASSVHGQLGGYDASTLECATPAGAKPPTCSALPNGRTQYSAKVFAPNANGANIPFAPLELYLMGLLPASEVPDPIHIMTEAQLDPDSYDPATERIIVEAKAITTLPFADITQRHGSVKPLPESERHFKAAFVVVSASPATDKVMTDVANWAAIWGNRKTMNGWASFETNTGGLATMKTALGARRDTSNPAPPVRERFECSELTQDCGRPELACQFEGDSYCALSGGVERDKPCNAAFACAPGLTCVSNNAAPDAFYCKPYCDPNDAASPSACAKLCGDNYMTVRNKEGTRVTGVCLP